MKFYAYLIVCAFSLVGMNASALVLWDDQNPSGGNMQLTSIADPFGTGHGNIGEFDSSSGSQWQNYNINGQDWSAYAGLDWTFTVDIYITGSQAGDANIMDDLIYRNLNGVQGDYTALSSAGFAIGAWNTITWTGTFDSDPATLTSSSFLFLNNDQLTQPSSGSNYYLDNFRIEVDTGAAPIAPPLITDPATMDQDGNGLPDIWEAQWNAFGLNPLDDTDGDGASNLEESEAGTNPLDADSVLIVSVTNPTPSDITISWPVIPERSSELMTAGSLSDGVWSNATGGVAVSNNAYWATLAVSPTSGFYYVANTPLDSDGDGVQDWLELELGFSITNSESVMGDKSYDTTGDGNPDTTLDGDLAAFNEVYNNTHITNSPTEAQAARFLMQATFGPTYQDILDLQAVGIDQWITDQMALPAYYHMPYQVQIYDDWVGNAGAPTNTAILGYAGGHQPPSFYFTFGNNLMTSWARGAIQAEDQLRQRVAWALSQILVVSRRDNANWPRAYTDYYDLFVEHAFGNYSNLLHDVTFDARMGLYLSHLGNEKEDLAIPRYPDENFAREILQLFSIGLWELNPDGTRKLDIYGEPIPTYSNTEITEFAQVFTGLKWDGYSWSSDSVWESKTFAPMGMFADRHDFSSKVLLNGYVIPARSQSEANALQDIYDALGNIMDHPNVGPFIGKQLIQFLVTSNPSDAYVARVSAVFDDNGSGVKGDLAATVRAVLTDPEARNPMSHLSRIEYGELREPAIRTMHLARVQDLGRFEHLKWWDWGEFQDDSLQEPVYSPSVFNYYRPDFSLPGDIAEGGYVSPAFGIMDSYSAISFPNRLWSYTNNGFKNGSNYNYPPDWSNFVPLVSDPAALVDRCSLLFCGGDMTPQTRELIIDSVSQLDAVTEQTERIRIAVYLSMMSPEGATLK